MLTVLMSTSGAEVAAFAPAWNPRDGSVRRVTSRSVSNLPTALFRPPGHDRNEHFGGRPDKFFRSRRILSGTELSSSSGLSLSDPDDAEILRSAKSASPLPPPQVRYNAQGWLSELLDIPNSRILRRILPHVLFNVYFALILSALSLKKVYRDNFFMAFPYMFHMLLGGSLSLLLVFRTNAAYDRWWEARKAWGTVIGHSREIIRVACQMLDEWSDIVRVARLLKAYPDLMRLHLTTERGTRMVGRRHQYNDSTSYGGEMERIIRASSMCEEDAYAILSGGNRPLETVRCLGDAIRDGFAALPPLSSRHNHQQHSVGIEAMAAAMNEAQQRHVMRAIVEERIAALGRSCGICERILNSPVPLSYSRHTSRFLSVWLGTLPLSLLPTIHLASPPPLVVMLLPAVMTGIASWALLAIEEIGHIIEEPFNLPFTATPKCPSTTLGMEGLCRRVNDDVSSALRREKRRRLRERV